MNNNMKKLFRNIMLVAMAALTFNACEDVPEPYDIPGTGNNQPGTTTEIEGAEGTGTLNDPFNAAAALNFGSTLASGEESVDYMYIKGIVVSVKEDFTTQYGNGTFYISSDGTTKNQFYAYRVLYLGNKKFTASDTQIKVGDEVIVCGKITNYNGTIETAQNKGFLYALNGENRGGEPASGGTESAATGDGTLENPYNAAGAIALAQNTGEGESADVYIKGKVASISEQYGTQYGNATFAISDDGTTGSTTFTVYRALYLGNQKYTSGDLLKEGDDVIIYGKVTNFRGNTPETVTGKAYLYSLNGNTGGGETPQPGGETKGTGTLEDPFNAAAANAYASSLAADAKSDKDVYIKGIIIDITSNNQFNTQYGNCTFYISDDGTDTADKFYVFRTLYLGNQKYTSGDLPKKGDEVIICGKVTNYKGNTPETVQNESYIYSLNGITDPGTTPEPPASGEAKGTGTLNDPYNALAAINVATALGPGNTSTDSYYIKGKVSSIKYPFDVEHGTATFFISDDGTTAIEFQCYSVYYLENKSWQTGFKQIAVGDDVIIYGQLTNYNGTPETASKKAYIYSLNGSTKAEEGSTPEPQPGGEADVTIDFGAQGYENSQSISTVTLSDGTTLTFSIGSNKNDPKFYTTGSAIRMYPGNTLTVTSSKQIASVVLNCSSNNAEGQVTASPGTVSTNDMAVTVSSVNSTTTTITNAHTGTGAVSQLRIATLSITYAK